MAAGAEASGCRQPRRLPRALEAPSERQGQDGRRAPLPLPSLPAEGPGPARQGPNPRPGRRDPRPAPPRRLPWPGWRSEPPSGWAPAPGGGPRLLAQPRRAWAGRAVCALQAQPSPRGVPLRLESRGIVARFGCPVPSPTPEAALEASAELGRRFPLLWRCKKQHVLRAAPPPPPPQGMLKG